MSRFSPIVLHLSLHKNCFHSYLVTVFFALSVRLISSSLRDSLESLSNQLCNDTPELLALLPTSAISVTRGRYGSFYCALEHAIQENSSH